MDVPQAVLNRRIACERWKVNHREYYLKQKRDLAARPAYRAICRDRYKAQRDALWEAGLLPRKLGRPVLYEGQEAVDRQRARARDASSRYRRRLKISRALLNHESTESPSSGEDSDRPSDSGWGTA